MAEGLKRTHHPGWCGTLWCQDADWQQCSRRYRAKE